MTDFQRLRSLLRDAAKCFEEASSPFSTEWLSENHVTADECIDLSNLIATAIQVYLALPKNVRMEYTLKSTVESLDISEDMKKDLMLSLDHVRVTQALKDLKK